MIVLLAELHLLFQVGWRAALEGDEVHHRAACIILRSDHIGLKNTFKGVHHPEPSGFARGQSCCHFGP